MAIAEISVVPIGTGTPSVSAFVASCVAVVRASGLKHELTAMGTIVEGPLAKLLDVVQRMHEVSFSDGAARVYSVIKIDDRRDVEASAADKVRAVEARMGEGT